MSRFLPPLLVALVCSARFTLADPPPHYYDSAEGRTGADLRAALHAIVRGHKVVPYASSTKVDTSDALDVLDRDPRNTNNVFLIYGTNTLPVSTFGISGGWNREHLWCDSYGLDGVQPAYSDLHNLRACDANVNSARGNKFYDAAARLAPGYRQPAHAEAAPDTATDSLAWQPPADQRGDIARALLYMTIRYTGDVAGEPQLVLTDATNLISASASYMGRYTTLLKWHFADPVSPAESNRNDQVCWLYQTNRNPFVDRPNWVAEAFIPRLRLDAVGTNLELRWAAEYAPTVKLEICTNLAAQAWAPLTNTPLLISNNWVIPLARPTAPAQSFYRLRLD